MGYMGLDSSTRTYPGSRTASGLSTPAIIRSLNRYLDHETYRFFV